MSKKLLSACLAALSLAACEESVSSKPTSISKPAEVKVVQKPVISSIEEKDKKDAGGFSMSMIDAGYVDPLVLSHDTPSVDHLGRAKQLQGEGDVKGALVEARRALFSTPTDEETLTIVAKLSRRTGQNELAAEAWGRIANIRTDDATPLIQQARAMIQMKDFAGAVIAGREAIARDAENAEAHQVTGIAQMSMNELAGAIASFKKAVEIEPGHGWAQNNLGFAYLRANENEKAVEVLEKAAELLPTVAYVHNNLGVALERTGRKDEAKAAYQQAMDLSPKYVKARINAARVAKVEDSAPEIDPGTMSDIPHPMPEQPSPEP